MLLEKNGKASSSNETHSHQILLRQGQGGFRRGPTGALYHGRHAGFFTKPLQGSLFHRFRDRIMNIDLSSVDHSTGRRSVLENNDRRLTDRCNATTDDDTKDNVGRIMNSGDVLDGSLLEDID